MGAMLDITELSRMAGVSSRTIRYYGELGLVKPGGRGPGGRRLFGTDASERLAFISRLKNLGLSLEEIGDLNRSFERGATTAMLSELEAMLQHRLREVESRRQELLTLESDLNQYLGHIRSKTT